MRAAAERIAEKLRSAGHEAYFVGGCVRDILLGARPKDFDVVTSARPAEVAELFDDTREVGKIFGVMLVVEGGFSIEVTTYRTEWGYSDGRRPDGVEFSDAEHDVMRRDFTVNGLLLDPATDKVIDRVGGEADLRARVIRTIGEPADRFGEDALRLLRAVRFAAGLGFEIEPRTRAALEGLAHTVSRVSAERVRDELALTLTGGGSARGVRLMAETGLLEVILPEVAAMRGVEQPQEFHPEGDVFEHTLLMLEHMDRSSRERIEVTFPFALAALLHDVGKPVTQTRTDRIRFNEHAPRGAEIAGAVCRRLRMSARQVALVVELVGDHMRFTMVKRMREAKLRRFFRRESFPLHLELHRLDCVASHGKLEGYDFCRSGYAQILEDERNRPPEPLITGRDLLEMGYAQGPVIGGILEAVEDARLEGEVSTSQEAREFVRKRLPPDGADGRGDRGD